MDAADRRILAQIQAEGRISLTELSDRVGLSLSPCQRRVRAMEQAGVIRGYRAQLDPTKVGLTFSAIVFVTLKEGTRDVVGAFETAVGSIREIVQAQRLFGDPDYMMQVVAADLEAFRELYDSQLTTLPGVLRINSTLVLKQVVEQRPLPL